MFAMVGRTAESNGLNFSKETHGYHWGWHKLNKFFFTSTFKIPRTTPGTSASL